jgi:hypothetical protein
MDASIMNRLAVATPDRGVDVVDLAAGLDQLRHPHGVVDGRPALDQLVTAEADPESQAVADDSADGVHDLEQQPGPLVERPAVAVRPAVGGRGEEAANDGGVRALELDPVEAALGTVLRNQRVPGHDLVDLGLVDRLGDLPEEGVGDGGRRPHRSARVHGRGLAAVVVDLGEDRRAVTVHGLSDAAVAGDHLAVEAVDQLLVGPVRRMRRVLLGDDEAGAALGAGAVVRGVLLGGPAVPRVVREVRAEHDPVAHVTGPSASGDHR